MRELEFRAWDKTTKRYWNVGGLSFEKGRLVEVYLENYSTSFEGNEDCKKPNEVILEQCTGLKDKNGKEIYDGDIVRGHSPYYIENFEIAWREDRAGWFGFATDDYTCPLCNIEHLKVIGNIHENKELLEE